jgi:hypothetical protein
MLLPPPANCFPSKNELVIYCKDFATSQGYELVTKDSRKDKYCVLQCDLGGDYRNRYNLNDCNRQRNTCSRKIGCKFSLHLSYRNGVWSFVITHDTHNHEANDLRGHPYHGSWKQLPIRRILRQNV